MARTLFEGAYKEVSHEMSGFSMLDFCEEKPTETLKENRTLQSSIKDESLIKAVVDRSISSDAQSLSAGSKSNDEKEHSLGEKDNQSVMDADGSSHNNTLTMFPPTFSCTSPVSQDTVSLLELVQSTPKDLHISNKNSIRKDQNDRRRVKVMRNASKSNLHRKTSKQSPIFTKIYAEEIQNQSDHFKDDIASDDMLVNVNSQNGISKMCDEKSRGSSVKDVSDVSFGSLSKSLEQAMVKETEIVSDLNANVCLEPKEGRVMMGIIMGITVVNSW